MASKRFFLIFSVFLLLSLALSACGGAAFVPSGWAGLTEKQGVAFLANNQFVYAIRVPEGTEIWRFSEKGETFFSNPAMTEDGQVIVGGYNKQIYSLSQETGKENWRFAAKDHFIAGPLVTGGMILAPNADGKLYALDLFGKLAWSYQASNAIWTQPLTDGECNCVYITSMDHKILSIDLKTRQPAWGPVDVGSSIVGAPTLSKDGILYIGTYGKEIVAVRANNGELLWRIPTNADIWSGPAVDADRLYYGDALGNFSIVNLADKKVVKMFTADGAVISTPLVTEDAVYFTTESGTIYKIDRDGKSLWSHNTEDGKTADGLVIGGKIYTSPMLMEDLILVAPMHTDPLLVGIASDGTQKFSYVPPKK
jgi:outer membrane protein assembly factor BamB